MDVNDETKWKRVLAFSQHESEALNISTGVCSFNSLSLHQGQNMTNTHQTVEHLTNVEVERSKLYMSKTKKVIKIIPEV